MDSDTPRYLFNLWKGGHPETLTGRDYNQDGDVIVILSPNGENQTYINLKAYDYVYIEGLEE